MGTIAEKLAYLNATKTAIKNAIVGKGVSVSDNDTFRAYAQKISAIETGGGEPVLVAKTVTKNGTYQASSDSADGYSEVTVNVRSIDGIPIGLANSSYIFSDLGLTWETTAEENI